ARVDVGRSPSFAFWFQADSGGGPGGFYDEQGRSLKRAFLRAPLQFRRVSSRVGSRFHPILHEWRIHEGTDYGAAHGTPVPSTAVPRIRSARTRVKAWRSRRASRPPTMRRAPCCSRNWSRTPRTSPHASISFLPHRGALSRR